LRNPPPRKAPSTISAIQPGKSLPNANNELHDDLCKRAIRHDSVSNDSRRRRGSFRFFLFSHLAATRCHYIHGQVSHHAKTAHNVTSLIYFLSCSPNLLFPKRTI
jgi:hypothetical protein